VESLTGKAEVSDEKFELKDKKILSYAINVEA